MRYSFIFITSLFIFNSLLYSCGNTHQTQQSTNTMNYKIEQKPFGTLPNGQVADIYTLRNQNGVEIRITNYGGIITNWITPDKNGNKTDVVLGFDSLSTYLKGHPFFGALVGRYGNRIGKAQFMLDGKTYTLLANNGPNSLHGGKVGFDKALWQTEVLEEQNALKMTYLSKDGEEGFPGNLSVTVIYKLTDDNTLEIDYTATTDKPTVVNLTNHTYFNLTGGKTDVLNHQMQLHADRFVVVDKTLIPTGELRSVKGTPFDFLTPTAIGARINDTTDEQIKMGGGYDHCWVANEKPKGELKPIASVYEPTTGRLLEVSTTEPGTQFYTGNFLDGKLVGKNGVKYSKRMGFCLETQHFPDSPNQPTFPSVVLRPNETYHTKTTFKFSAK